MIGFGVWLIGLGLLWYVLGAYYVWLGKASEYSMFRGGESVDGS